MPWFNRLFLLLRSRPSAKRLVVISALLLSACTSRPQVHVFSRYLDSEQQSAIGQALIEQKFEVTFNDYEFPSSVDSNTIVHAALSLNAEQHAQLVNALQHMGFDNVESQYVGKGKHSFTRNHLGIYLYGNKEQEAQDPMVLSMLNEYSATMCRTLNFAYLTLQEDNRVSIILEDQTQPKDAEKHLGGAWLIDGDSLYVNLDGENFTIEFIRKKIQESTKYGPRVGWKLNPVNGGYAVDHCEFEHTRVLRE